MSRVPVLKPWDICDVELWLLYFGDTMWQEAGKTLNFRIKWSLFTSQAVYNLHKISSGHSARIFYNIIYTLTYI